MILEQNLDINNSPFRAELRRLLGGNPALFRFRKGFIYLNHINYSNIYINQL